AMQISVEALLVPARELDQSNSAKTVVIISALSSVAAIALTVLVVVLFCKQSHDLLNSTFSSNASPSSQAPLFRNGAANTDIKWEDIMEATHGLDDEFMIGSGGSGKVYKADLKNGETIAVKKILWKDDLMSNKSFNIEVKTLGTIRHRHLVKLMEYAYSLKATEKSDVYSMGIVLMEIVTGKKPTDEVLMKRPI
ncbi:LOW QUALITY PROTEIN: hypothetical protein HID58_094797, partial [Brassica napus]